MKLTVQRMAEENPPENPSLRQNACGHFRTNEFSALFYTLFCLIKRLCVHTHSTTLRSLFWDSGGSRGLACAVTISPVSSICNHVFVVLLCLNVDYLCTPVQ